METTPQNPANDGHCCCLCGGSQFELLHSWEPDHPRNSASIQQNVWMCECGLVALHPVPTPEQLPLAGEWWTKKRKFVRRNAWLKNIRKPIQNFIFGEPKARLIRQTLRVVPEGRLLDIGCGTGKLLRIAHKWYECEGVEPSSRAVSECRDQGFQVQEGFFEDVELPAERYQVATMDAVLEHVIDPVETLLRTNRVLCDGGVVAIKVPKFGGPAYRRHGREWNGFRVGYHLHLFTGQTLAACLEKAGFEVLSRPKRDRPLDDILGMWGRKVRNVESDLADRAA